MAVVERETSAWPASSPGPANGVAQGLERFPRAHAMCAYTLVPPEPEMLVVEDCLADRRCSPSSHPRPFMSRDGAAGLAAVRRVLSHKSPTLSPSLLDFMGTI